MAYAEDVPRRLEPDFPANWAVLFVVVRTPARFGPRSRSCQANTGGTLNVFMDAEFNGFGGDLISIALVCEDGQEWYEVAEIPAEPHPFVVQHLLPVLGKEPIGRDCFAQSLAEFLASVPEPAGYHRGLAGRYPLFIATALSRPVWQLHALSSGLHLRAPVASSLPCALQTMHNALLDAWALRLWHAGANERDRP